MSELNLDKLADSWIRMHHAVEESEDYKKNFWAYSELCDLCDDEPDDCFEVIELIRAKDGSDIIQSNLAAGPLEDLLSQHGEMFIDKIEQLAKNDIQFKKILGAVWQNSISDSVWSRIQRVASNSW